MLTPNLIANAKPRLVADTQVNKGRRYRRSRRQGGDVPYYTLDISTIPMDYRTGQAMAAWIDSLMGAYTLFALPNPFLSLAQNTGVTVRTSTTGGAVSIALGGFSPGKMSAAVAGDFIRFAGNAKCYRVVQGCNSDSNGYGTITITPPLIADVTAGTELKYGDDVVFQVSLDDYHEMEVDKPTYTITYEFEVIEQG